VELVELINVIKSRKAVRALSPEEFSLLTARLPPCVEHIILPALWEGKLVIADRFSSPSGARSGESLDLIGC